MGDQVHIIVTETPEYELQSIEAVQNPDIIPTDPLPKVQINHDTDYWLTMPAENVKITGYFVGKIYGVKVSSSEHGSPSVDKAEARYGQKVTITPNPKAGYSLNAITVVTSQGTPVQVTPQHEFYMPADDVVVTVTYTAGTYNITLSQQTGGTISAPQTATVDSVVTVTVVPQTDYELDHLTITKSGGGNVSVTEDNKFIMPAANVTITAVWKLTHEIDHVVRFSTDDASVGDVRIYRKDHTMLIFQGDISTDDTTHTKRIDNVVITESTWS
jgi:archaellum component FlaF (FlaF/FlaG flagellin family)